MSDLVLEKPGLPNSTVYLWTLLALAAGALGILLLVLCLRAWRHTRIH